MNSDFLGRFPFAVLWLYFLDHGIDLLEVKIPQGYAFRSEGPCCFGKWFDRRNASIEDVKTTGVTGER